MLNPDTANTRNGSYTKIYTPEITISNIDYRKLFLNKEIAIHSVNVKKPEISMPNGELFKFNALTKNEQIPNDTLLTSLVTKISIDTLELIDAIYDIEELNTKSPLKAKLPVINIVFSNFVIDNSAQSIKRNKFEVSDINLKINNVERFINNNVYKVVVGEIRMSLINQIIKAQNLSLQPQQTNVEKPSTLTINIPEIQLKSSHLKEFLKSDTIIMTSLILLNPKIEIAQGRLFDKSKQINSIDLYDLIKNELKLIKIDTLKIKNGNAKMFSYQSSTSNQEFAGLNFDLFNFILDKKTKDDPKRLFYGKNGIIHLDHFTLNHNDKIHQLTIDSIDFNTFNRTVSTGIINFKPVTSQSNNEKSTRINTICKGMLLNDVDLYKFYHNQQLNIKSLHILPTNLRLTRTEYENKISKIETKNILLDKISGYFKSIYIDKISIEKSGLNYNYINDEDQNGYFKTNFTINLDNFSIDSTSFAISNKIFFANQFDLKFTTFALQLADNIHFLSIDTITLSSKRESAEIANLQLAPLPDSIISAKKPTGKRLELLKFKMPKIILSNANFHRAFFQKELFIDSVTINRPEFIVESYSTKNDLVTQNQPTENKLNQLIAAYLTNVEIKTINIDKGLFSIIQYFKNGKQSENSNSFTAKLQNLQLDSLSDSRQNKLLYSDNFDIIIHDHLFKLADGVHVVKAKEIGFLTSQQKIYIQNALLYPDSLAPRFSKLNANYYGTFPRIELNNCNLIEAFHSKNLKVEDVLFLNPDFSVLQNNTNTTISKDSLFNKMILLPYNIKSLSMNNLNVKAGEISIINNSTRTKNPIIKSKIDFSVSNVFLTQKSSAIAHQIDNFKLILSQFQSILPDSLHQISSDLIEINKNDSTLKCKNLKIEPKHAISSSTKKTVFNLVFPVFEANGVNFDDFLKSNSLNVRQIIASSPSIYITNKNSENKQKFNPYSIDISTPIKKHFNKFKIDDVTFSDITFNLKGSKNLTLTDFDIHAANFNPLEHINNSKLFMCSKVRSQIRNFKRTLPSGFYTYSVDVIEYNSTGSLTAKNIHFQPTFSIEEYFNKKKFQEDYVKMRISSIELKQFNFEKLFTNNEISAQVIKSNVDSIQFYRDKRLPLKPDKFAKLPQQILREAKLGLTIDSTIINCKYLEYKEQEKLSKKTGSIHISNIGLNAFNLTNIERNVNKNNLGKLHFNGMIMDKGALKVEMNFPLNSKINSFTINGKCDSIPLAEFNSITESNMFLSVKEGTLNKLAFDFEANEDSAYGKLQMGYDNLKISVLEKKTGSAKEDKLASFFANSFIIRSENSENDAHSSPANISANRDKKRSIVNFCWKSIFSGMKETLGIKTKEAKAPE